MHTYELSAQLDHLAAHQYIIQTRDIIAATGRSRRTVLSWLENGAPCWVWPCVLAYRGIFQVDGEYWRIDRDKQEIITPDRDIRRLGEIRGFRYVIGAKNTYRAASELAARRIADLEAENMELRAQRKKRPVVAANEEW